MTADTTPSIVATTAPERLTKLRNWLRGLRALSIRQDGAGQVFAGILEAFEERGCAPETVATDIDALLARAEAAEANARRLAEACEPCGGLEQPAFEAWAKARRYDMSEHPLHYLFLDKQTDAARQGWKAGIAYALAALTTKEAERG